MNRLTFILIDFCSMSYPPHSVKTKTQNHSRYGACSAYEQRVTEKIGAAIK